MKVTLKMFLVLAAAGGVLAGCSRLKGYFDYTTPRVDHYCIEGVMYYGKDGVPTTVAYRQDGNVRTCGQK